MASKKKESYENVKAEVISYKEILEEFRGKSRMVLSALQSLDELDGIDYDIIKETGIGKTVNSFRKEEEVGDIVKRLVVKWKAISKAAVSKLAPKSDSSNVADDKNVTSSQSKADTEEKTQDDIDKYAMHSNGIGVSGKLGTEKLKNADTKKEDSKRQSNSQIISGETNKHLNESRKRSNEEQVEVYPSKNPKYCSDDHHEAKSKMKLDSTSENRNSDKYLISEKSSQLNTQEKFHNPAKIKPKSEISQMKQNLDSKSKNSDIKNIDICSLKDKSKDLQKSISTELVAENHKKSSSTGKSHSSSKDLSEEAKKSAKLEHHSSETSSKKKHKHDKSRESRKEKNSNSSSQRMHRHFKHLVDKESECDGAFDSFEQALSSSSSLDKNKKKKEKVSTFEEKIAKTVSLSPLPKSILEDLPPVLTVYKPLPRSNDTEARQPQRSGSNVFEFKDIKASSRSDAVYSGRRRGVTSMLSLKQLCLNVLGNHLDDLGYVGGVPYHILEPVLKKATTPQLFSIENYNPTFICETGSLWKDHCQRDFKGQEPDEFESWRELYLRKYDEREAKFETLQKNLAAKEHKKQSEVRKSLVAYTMATQPKPPREVRIKQAKYGTGSGSVESTARAAAIMKNEKAHSSSGVIKLKTKVEPLLMKKTKKFMSKLHR